MKSTVYYILDPMCAWCWGFAPVFAELLELLPEHVEVEYVMGGLAADSDEPMPKEMQDYIQQQWRLVTKNTGVEFNWSFWEHCSPRRSTYPACRAVIAAGLQGTANIPKMIASIQRAYYQEAKNPSNVDTLLSLAKEIDLDTNTFESAIQSNNVENLLQGHFKTRRRLAVTSFPTVLYEADDGVHFISQGDSTINTVKQRLQACSLL